MDKKKFTRDEIATSLNEMLDQASSARTPGMRAFARLQDKRSTRLSNLEVRLKASLGENHPQVVALRSAASRAMRFAHSLGTAAERASRRPKVGPEDWLVFGRILKKKGNPISGVRVRVYDKDFLYDDLLGATTSDEYGDFFIIYHERDFAEIIDKLPDLYVRVEDERGNLLYSSEESIRFNVGRLEYFEIVIE